MDLLTLTELSNQLGGAAKEARGYDEIMLTPGHVERIKDTTSVESAVAKFPGLNIVSSPLVPDGYGVLRSGGKVIGVLNFKDGTLHDPDRT
jgi:hypothetical protein